MKLKAILVIASILCFVLIAQPQQVKAQEGIGFFQAIWDIILTAIRIFHDIVLMLFPFMTSIVGGLGMIVAGLFSICPEFFIGFFTGVFMVYGMGYLVLAIPNPLAWFNILLALFGIVSPFLVLDISAWLELVLGFIPAMAMGLFLGVLGFAQLPSPAERQGINTSAILQGVTFVITPEGRLILGG